MIKRLVDAADALVIYPEQFQGDQYEQYKELKAAVKALAHAAVEKIIMDADIKSQFDSESG